MPQIVPVAAPMPSAPAPVAGVTPAAPAAADGAPGSDFMGQLAVAVKSLKGLAAAVKATAVAIPQVPDGTPDAAKDDAAPAAPSDEKLAATDDVLELLASLGLAPVPNPQTAPLATNVAAPTGKGPIAPQPGPMLPQEQLNPKVAQQPDAGTPQMAATPPEPGKHAPTPGFEVPAQLAAVDATRQSATPPVDAQPVAQPHAAQPQPTPAPQLTTLPPELQQQGQGESAFQQSNTGDPQHDHADAKADSLTTQAVPDRVYADAAASTAPTTAPTANDSRADSQAVQVANQIAQQVDLYRLPGNKGVRIQLHPEDLGGVQVTLKYASGGSLELHISVEHASTGTLVQAGLDHLRDALATQGFHPDRMVMSISAPSGASQMDFNSNNSNNSNNGGSNRSNAGLNAFMQDNQSGQQRSGGDDQRNGLGWTVTTDASSASDDSPRNGSIPSVGNSVIDYRV